MNFLFLIQNIILIYYYLIDQWENNPPPDRRNPRTQSQRLPPKRRVDTRYILDPTQKWTKGKAKEKVDNAVFIDKATHERLLQGIPKIGKHISVPQVVDKYKIVGSIARALLRELVATGALKVVEQHSKQGLYTPAVVAAEKTAAVPEKEAGKGKAQAKKPAKEAKEAK